MKVKALRMMALAAGNGRGAGLGYRTEIVFLVERWWILVVLGLLLRGDHDVAFLV